MFKNWPAINRIKDADFKWAMALLNINSEFGKMIVNALPEFFSESDEWAPIPFSVMRKTASDNGVAQMSDKGADRLKTFDAIPEWMPLLHFVTILAKQGKWVDPGAQIIPTELLNALLEGSFTGRTYSVRGKQLILVDFRDQEWYFAPADCIDTTK